MAWLSRKADVATDPLSLSKTKPFSAYEEMASAIVEGVPEIERMIPGLQDFMGDPGVRLEMIEELEQELQYIQAGEWTEELKELEKDLFKSYTQRYPEQVQEKGLDELYNAFHSYFVQTVVNLLQTEIEKTKSAKLKKMK